MDWVRLRKLTFVDLSEFVVLILPPLLTWIPVFHSSLQRTFNAPEPTSDYWRWFLKKALITLTLGGNDLLAAFRRNIGNKSEQLAGAAMSVLKQYERAIDAIEQRQPGCVLILTTVFDPTDGTGVLPSTSPLYETPLPIEYLTHFNNHVKVCARSRSAILADVHKHFFGHGAECGSVDGFWYWKPSPIEPSYRGSSEIRRVWLETLEAYLGTTP